MTQGSPSSSSSSKSTGQHEGMGGISAFPNVLSGQTKSDRQPVHVIGLYDRPGPSTLTFLVVDSDGNCSVEPVESIRLVGQYDASSETVKQWSAARQPSLTR